MENKCSKRLLVSGVSEYIDFIVEDGVYWYNFNQLTDYLMLTDAYKLKIYKHYVAEENKKTFEYDDEFNHHKHEKFITTEAVSEIISRNNEKANSLLKTIINNETKYDEDFREFDNDLDRLSDYMSKNQNDFVGIQQIIEEIHASDSYKCIKSKYDKSYDIEKENMIEDFRELVYEACDETEEDEIYFGRKLTKKEVVYTKQKIEKPSIPAWLKEIVKQ